MTLTLKKLIDELRTKQKKRKFREYLDELFSYKEGTMTWWYNPKNKPLFHESLVSLFNSLSPDDEITHYRLTKQSYKKHDKLKLYVDGILKVEVKLFKGDFIRGKNEIC